MTPRTISAAHFKARCLKLMDEVNKTGKEIIITKRGKPVARLTAPKHARPSSGFGYMKGTVKILGDIVGPLGVKWDAEQQ